MASYTANITSGSVTVNGGPVSRSITFTPAFHVRTTYAVTFSEGGLTSGTSWSVTLNGSTLSSTTPTITLQEVNGSYAFTVGTVSGYSSSPSSGTVKVNSGPAGQSITFTGSSSTGKTNQTTGFLGLPGSEGYILIVAIVAVVAAVVVAVLLARKRKGGQVPTGPQPPPPPWAE